MADFSRYHFVIKDRVESEGAKYYEDYWWEKEIKQFTANLPEFMLFLDTECSDEELYWISEIFEDLLIKTKSDVLLACLFHRIAKMKDSKRRAEVMQDLRDAVEMAEMEDDLNKLAKVDAGGIV